MVAETYGEIRETRDGGEPKESGGEEEEGDESNGVAKKDGEEVSIVIRRRC